MGEGIGKERPDLLKGNMVVGKWNYIFTGEDEQFSGSISNLAFFGITTDQEDLATLTDDLCKAPGPLLSWRDIKWRVEGEVIELETSSGEVCNQVSSYSLLITEPIGQEAAVATCGKLGHGKMVEAATKEEASKLVSCFFGTINASSQSLLLGRHQWNFMEDSFRYGKYVYIK